VKFITTEYKPLDRLTEHLYVSNITFSKWHIIITHFLQTQVNEANREKTDCSL